MTLEKIIISNINDSFFEVVGINRKNDDDTIKGSLVCLSEWLSIINNDIKDDIINPLKKLRKIRQSPAHKIEQNTFDKGYFKEQQDLSDRVYYSLYLLRKLIQSHPNAKKLELDYPDADKYIII